MARWMKVESNLAVTYDGNKSFALSAASVDQLQKHLLLRRVIEVTSGSSVLPSAAFTQAMSAMDSISTSSHNVAPTVDYNLPILCPSRSTKKGRPSNSSLQSWKDEQKRKKRESTDEENPRGGKTRLVSDVL